MGKKEINIFIICILLSGISGCKKPLTNKQKLMNKYSEVTKELSHAQDTAAKNQKEAIDKYWENKPVLQRIYQINKETTECLSKTPLGDIKERREFYDHWNDQTRVTPDRVMIEKQIKHYEALIECFREDYSKINPLLKGEI